jgi:hypothetical protein
MRATLAWAGYTNVIFIPAVIARQIFALSFRRIFRESKPGLFSKTFDLLDFDLQKLRVLPLTFDYRAGKTMQQVIFMTHTRLHIKSTINMIVFVRKAELRIGMKVLKHWNDVFVSVRGLNNGA